MKCYHCGQNEAVHRFLVNYMGQVGEVHLCRACVEMFSRQAFAMYREYGKNAAAPGGECALAFQPGEEDSGRNNGADPFPEDAGEEVRRRRLLNALRARLGAAVQEENFEEAAVLRDQIADMEKEVYLYDT